MSDENTGELNLPGLAALIVAERKAQGCVILVLHEGNRAEVLIALAKDVEYDVPSTLRSIAGSLDDENGMPLPGHGSEITISREKA